MSATKASWSVWIDCMVTHFWVRPIHPTKQPLMDDEPAADTGTDGHVKKDFAVLASPPATFSQGGSIGIIFDGDGQIELFT
ncbi:hypothetical protein SDC9_123812 [bioreactor metagenome]|uniref:Uncharacterized protein n=1 Tax=bioreactor metagenome TaxID=1076179 RepID=A0A645CIS0_9ZZZZ